MWSTQLVFKAYLCLGLFVWMLNGITLVESVPAVKLGSKAYPKKTNQNLYRRVPLKKGNDSIYFDVYFVDLDHSELNFYHEKPSGEKIKNIKTLKTFLESGKQKLLFATNGGMFNPEYEPVGFYLENGIEKYPLNLKKGGNKFTNFYDLAPNGVFYIQQDNKCGIVPRHTFTKVENVKHATQSAPMLIVNKEINKKFNSKSKSVNIRNGVGVTKKNGIMDKFELMFAISNTKVSFHDFSRIFLYYGCEQALYLDGYVSEMYVPDTKNTARTMTQNDFALMIGVTENF
ncbi:MAG: phosphodiester glycosidase family protein [Saprospiraceae bacterium]